MKTYYIIGLILVILLLAGCQEKVGEVVEDNLSEDTTETSTEYVNDSESVLEDNITVEDTTEQENQTSEENKSVTELYEELSEEVGLETDDDESDEDVETQTASDNPEIIINNFRGDPSDLNVEKGTTVKWINKMHFQNVIIILPQEEDSSGYSNKWINDIKKLWINESYEYTFNQTGKYQWGSKTDFDHIQGIITVTE